MSNSQKSLLCNLLCRRGPDAFGTREIDIQGFKICATSSVLCIRGDQPTYQPLFEEKTQRLLQWNGEIYECSLLLGAVQESNLNDGKVLFDYLNESEENFEYLLLRCLSTINGEFCFSLFDGDKNWYVGRDFFGRRSLCWNLSVNVRNELQNLMDQNTKTGWLDAGTIDHLSVASLSPNSPHWSEMPACGLFKITFENSIIRLQLMKWQFDAKIENSLIFHKPFLCSPLTNQWNACIENVSAKEHFDQAVSQFLDTLRKAVRLRTQIHNHQCAECLNKQTKCLHATVAILFSGGIDCTLLALLSDEFVDLSLPIPLLNVSFDSNSPDRQTGLASFEELKNLRPNRQWQFFPIDVSLNQLSQVRSEHIRKLLFPSNTVLDDSIGCALWFAASGAASAASIKAIKCETISEQNYCIGARVLLLGMGADEQLGGYSRHRSAFFQGGWNRLQEELIYDVERISARNLGRDDRVISDHGLEARFPYLDEKVVSLLNSLSIQIKCNPTLGQGVGDKRLLRAAAFKLGLEKCSAFHKRAIQFGSRIAKLENRKEKASDSCDRLFE